MHRRIGSFLLALACVLVSSTSFADCDDPFSDPDEVLEFHLELTSTDWQALSESEKTSSDCDGQYPYMEAGFRCGEEEPITIGVRRRRDRSETTQKLPLKLDFNRFVQGQRWPVALGDLGFRRLSLNSGQPDDAGGEGSNGPGSNTGVLSALLTEHLAWRLMGEELPEVGGVAFARVTLHFTDSGESQYQGVYVLIEDMDRTAVRRRFTADQGTLYKTTDPACVDKAVFDDGSPNAATDNYDEWLALGSEDYLGTWQERSNEAVYLDALFRQEALRELFANTADTVLGANNNYYALDLYGAKRMYLPWDLDDMFRPQPQIRDVDTPLIVACSGGFGDDQCTSSTVGMHTRAGDELRPLYLEILCRLTNGVGDEDKVLAELNALDSMIRPIVGEEVATLWEPKDQDPLDEGTAGTYAAEVERMQTWIPQRIQAVRQMIADEGVVCSRGCEEGASAQCDYFGCPSSRTCNGGLWGSCEPTAAYVPGALDIDCDGIPEELPPQSAAGSGGTTGSGGESGGGGSDAGTGAMTSTGTGGDEEAGGVGGQGSESGLDGVGGQAAGGESEGTGGLESGSGTGDADSGVAQNTAESAGDEGGCGCRVVTSASGSGAPRALFLLIVGAAAWRRRRSIDR